tara:strand:+ start:264 stop:482 length:219 start_codon:yes stop_codon:yes gene_type:complete
MFKIFAAEKLTGLIDRCAACAPKKIMGTLEEDNYKLLQINEKWRPFIEKAAIWLLDTNPEEKNHIRAYICCF